MLARDTYFGGPNAYKTVITSKDKEEAFVKTRVKEFHKSVEMECRNRGYIETLTGRRRDFPAVDSRNSNASAAAIRTAVNTICQGSAADLINIATLQIYERFCGAAAGSVPEVRIVNQVHDELILELPQRMVTVRHHQLTLSPLRSLVACVLTGLCDYSRRWRRSCARRWRAR